MRIGYMGVEEQVDRDFERARLRSFLVRLAARFVGEADRGRLASFDEVRREERADNRVYRGRREVEVSRVVGSVGRYGAFDRGFLPRKSGVRERWKRIDRAFHRGEELPPVSLYKLGADYFVHDGNHRVSVARYQGVETLDAYVTEFFPHRPVNGGEETARPDGPRGCKGLAPEPCCC